MRRAHDRALPSKITVPTSMRSIVVEYISRSVSMRSRIRECRVTARRTCRRIWHSALSCAEKRPRRESRDAQAAIRPALRDHVGTHDVADVVRRDERLVELARHPRRVDHLVDRDHAIDGQADERIHREHFELAVGGVIYLRALAAGAQDERRLAADAGRRISVAQLARMMSRNMTSAPLQGTVSSGPGRSHRSTRSADRTRAQVLAACVSLWDAVAGSLVYFNMSRMLKIIGLPSLTSNRHAGIRIRAVAGDLGEIDEHRFLSAAGFDLSLLTRREWRGEIEAPVGDVLRRTHPQQRQHGTDARPPRAAVMLEGVLRGHESDDQRIDADALGGPPFHRQRLSEIEQSRLRGAMPPCGR